MSARSLLKLRRNGPLMHCWFKVSETCLTGNNAIDALPRHRQPYNRPLSRAAVHFSAAAVKSRWRAGAPWKIRLAAARTFSGGCGGDFSASLSEHSNKRYNR